MTDSQADASIRRLYLLTASFAVIGFICWSILKGLRPGFSFLLGSAISLANLWLFNYLSRAIAPAEKARETKPWSARSFITRYLLLLAAGYAITRALGADPLSVVLGLFASTAAVLLTAIAQLLPIKWNRNSG